MKLFMIIHQRCAKYGSNRNIVTSLLFKGILLLFRIRIRKGDEQEGAQNKKGGKPNKSFELMLLDAAIITNEYYNQAY